MFFKSKRLQSKISILLILQLLFSFIPAFHYVAEANTVTTTDMVEDFEGFASPFNFGTGAATKQFNWRANAAGGPWLMGTEPVTVSKAVYLNNQSTANSAMWNEDFNKSAYPDSSGNMLVSAKVNILNSNSSGMIGIGARLKDANTNYILDISGISNGTGNLEIRRKTSTNYACPSQSNALVTECVLASAPVNISNNVYYTLTFLVNGSTLVGSINGGPTIQATNTDIQVTDGTARAIGFRSSSLMVAYIDDVKAAKTFPNSLASLTKQAAIDNKVILSWGSVSNDQGYSVKRGTSATGPFSKVATVTGTTYMDDVPNGTNFYYTVSPLVKAADGSLLESILSNVITATPQAASQPPSAPSGISKSVGNATVDLSWNPASDATSYIIQRSQDTPGNFNQVGPAIPASKTSFSETALQNGTAYYYKVTAVNSAGTTDSSVIAATPSFPPAEPAGLIAIPGNAKVNLSWNSVVGASYYKVFRSGSQNGNYLKIADTVTGTTYTDQDPAIVNGNNYYYYVQAGDNNGLSSQNSNIASATPNSKYLGLTPSVTSSGNDGNAAANATDNNLTTRWGVDGLGEWIQYDLGNVSSIGYLGMSFYKGNTRSSKFDVYTSTDGSNWTKSFSGQSSGVLYDMETVDLPDVNARYVKIVAQGNSVNSYFGLNEIQIYAPNPNGNVVDTVPVSPILQQGSKPVKAGLYNMDGTPHTIPAANPVTGQTIDVTTYGADKQDNNNDDRAAVQNAIDSAQPGDEIYFPNGVYNLKSAHPTSTSANFVLKNGVNLRGESQDGVILLSDFDNRQLPDHSSTLSNASSRVLQGFNLSDVQISNLTISSTWNWIFPTDPNDSAYAYKGGPKNGIYLDEPSTLNPPNVPHNIWIDHVTIEKFEKTGIRLSRAHDVVIQNSIFRQATDIGPGGAGYGIALQGIFKDDRFGFYNDTQFNVIRNNTFDGTDALRHGVIIQAYAHNNAIYGNTIKNTTLDSIDLHGEFEYLNEVYNNTITGTKRGGGVGLGNTGGGYPSNHSASGPYNYIHDNLIQNTMQGMLIYMGTPDTIIEHNTIEWTVTGSTYNITNGIDIKNAPRTIIRNNTIRGFTGTTSSGIYIAHDPGDVNAGFIGAGDPRDLLIQGNTITGNTVGITMDVGTAALIANTIDKNASGNTKINPSAYVFDRNITVSEDTYVSMANPGVNYGSAKSYSLNTNGSGTSAGIAYYKFSMGDTSDILSASLQLSGKLLDANPGADPYTFNVYGLADDSWNANSINWTNSPNHTAAGDVSPSGATLLGSFTIVGNAVNSYNISNAALTNFVKSQSDVIASFMVVDTRKQNADAELFSKEKEFDSIVPMLKLQTVAFSPQTLNNLTYKVVLKDSSGTPMQALNGYTNLKAYATIGNPTSSDVSVSFIAAVYNSNGSVVFEKHSAAAVMGGQSNDISLDIQLPADGTTLKMFFWDSLTGMHPYTSPLVIQ